MGFIKKDLIINNAPLKHGSSVWYLPVTSPFFAFISAQALCRTMIIVVQFWLQAMDFIGHFSFISLEIIKIVAGVVLFIAWRTASISAQNTEAPEKVPNWLNWLRFLPRKSFFFAAMVCLCLAMVAGTMVHVISSKYFQNLPGWLPYVLLVFPLLWIDKVFVRWVASAKPVMDPKTRQRGRPTAESLRKADDEFCRRGVPRFSTP